MRLCAFLLALLALFPSSGHAAMTNTDRLKVASDFQTLHAVQHALIFLPAGERAVFFPILAAMEAASLAPADKTWVGHEKIPDIDGGNEIARAIHASLTLDAALLGMKAEDDGVSDELMVAAYALYDANRHLAYLTGYEMPPFPKFSDEKPEDRQRAVMGEKELFSFWMLAAMLATLMILLPVSGLLYRRYQIRLSLKKPRKIEDTRWEN